MTDDESSSLEAILEEFFDCIEPEHIHESLHALQAQAQRSRFSELPRADLVSKAIQLEEMKQGTSEVLNAVCEQWGAAEATWDVPEPIKDALSHLFNVFCFMDAERDDHTEAASIPPTTDIRFKRNGRRNR